VLQLQHPCAVRWRELFPTGESTGRGPCEEGDGGRMVFRCPFVSFWQGELSLAAHIASLLAEHSQVHGMRHGNQ
jgi:hypothetical protein